MTKAILFDLDGTLLDTGPDLAYALNTLLIEQQRQPLPYQQIRPVASHGSKGLLQLGFNIDEQHPNFAAYKQRLLTIYHANIANETRIFNGIDSVLDYLQQRKIPWGIVTNKPAWLTEKLIEKIDFAYTPSCIISGDTVSRAKPFPDPLLHACKLIGQAPADCWYIGDAERDIQAGKSAGMKTLIALYGYIAAADDPQQWQADGVVSTPPEIIDWLL